MNALDQQGKSCRRTGTKEWSDESVNCITGCSHDCRYCYARHIAVDRFGRVEAGQWRHEQVRPKAVRQRRGKCRGTVMFPTTHDITPENLAPCLDVISHLLDGGNDVLIVSKPHLACIAEICKRLVGYKDKIVFRFSIGAMNDDILGYWDRHAPNFEERLACLKHAFAAGFVTSISMEPLLDPPSAGAIVQRLRPYVNESIWIGMLNQIGQRVKCENEKDSEMVRWLRQHQTDAWVMKVVAAVGNDPLIRWKESYREVIGRLRGQPQAPLPVTGVIPQKGKFRNE